MNRQFSINDVFMPGITGGEPDRVRQAFHAPDLLSGAEVGQRDSAAEQLGMSWGEADAGWDDASTELKIRKAEAVPGADRWVQDAPENVTFLQEDAEGLMAVYQSLQDSGFLSADDLDEGTAQEIAQGGHGLVDTLERSRLANERTDLGAAVLEGSMEPDEARARLADIDSRMAALAKRRNDPAGFYSFVEQGYRMVSRDLPQAGRRALEGGLTGASAGAIAGTIAGSAVPVVGNLTGAVGGSVAGGIAGVGAGLSRGMYESAQHMEEANFLADLLNEKDDAGNFLDVDEIREKAQLYGMGSALVEMAGDALSAGAAKLIAPFLKTAAANLGGKSLQLFTKDAIKAAIRNRQAWPVMRRFLLGMGAGAAAEGAEEAVQEGVSASIEAWLKNSLNEQGKAYFRDEQEGLFSVETWAAMAESGLEGAKVGAWFVLLPGIAQLFVDAGKVSRAREFAQGVKDVGAVVAKSATAQMAPARMDTFLQANGLNQTVYIPADAAWQMQTQGTDLVAALGWTQESLEEAASLGHDIAVPLSRLVSRLDSGTLNAVADIMREGPNTMNVFEAEDPNAFLQEDVDAISAAAEEWEFEQDMLDAELDRVRTSITEAVRSVPALLNQIVGSVDPETSVSTYVDTIMTIIEQAAQRLRVYGDDVGSIIQKLNFEGLIRGADGRLHTADEIKQMVAEEAQAEADRPFWDNVWGRLDADSLKRDFPEARRELARKHGYGLFSRKGEGIAVDELAAILKNAGWLEQDADSSTLVEALKSKKRPKARKAGKSAQGLFQNELAQAVIKDTEKGGSIELADGSYVYWESTNDPVEIYDEDGNRDVEDGPEYMLISSLYVSPESRGRGLGRRLLRSALNRISKRRPDINVRLSADPIADEAVAQEALVEFYGSEGFREEFVDGMSGVPMTWNGRPRWADEDTLYQSYPELDDQRRAAVDAWLDAHPDGAEIRQQLELHQGTPWEAQAVESILIRIAMNDIMEGRGHPPFETKLGAKSAEGVVKYLRRGEEGLWQYLGEKGMLGEAAKPGLDVNGSFINCRPSEDCARYCYAAKGNYMYPVPAVKSELVSWAVEHDAQRAAKIIAREYMATMEYDAGKALRLFDKGDIHETWVPLIQELNRRGIRTQVFSKRPHILRQLDPQMNVIMLSIDKTNWNMADEHPDLPIAFVYSGREDLPFLERNEERFKAHGGVVLPVMQGRKTLPKEELEALPKWARRYACPIDSGKKTLYNRTKNPGGWKCAHCDRDGGIGCFYGRTALPNYKEIKGNGLFVETGKRNTPGARGHIDEANLYELFRAASVEDRQRILDEMARIHAELRERDIDRGQGTLLPTFGGVDGRASLGNRSGAGSDAAGRLDADTLEQRAWHGTPHDFEEFLLSHIGTGEGAQVHGWGLYFAGKRGTSEDYRARLTENSLVYIVRGEKFQKTDDGWKSLRSGVTLEENAPTSLVLDAKDRRGWDEDVLEELKHDRSLYEEDEDYQNDADWQAFDEAVRIMESGPVELGEAGQLFEVEIPDNDVLLDEQKSFEEQPEKVKAALRKLVENMTDEQMEDAGQDVGRIGRKKGAENILKTFSGTTGKKIYDTLDGVFGSPREASEALNEAGIKGITYEGGRDGRCFVVFDDKAIEVIDKYYQFLGEKGAARLDEAEEASVRMDNLAVAREMEEAGKDAAAIKLATGWERGADGKWRYEVMDPPTAFDVFGDAKKLKSVRAKAKRDLKKAEEKLEGVPKQAPEWEDLMMAVLQARDFVQVTDAWAQLAKHMQTGMGPIGISLRYLMPDSDLFVAYPDLQFLRVEVSPGGRGTGALATRGDELGYISLNLNTTIGASKLLRHEIQHAIQHIEGFAPGGSPADMVGSIDKEGRTDAEVYEEAHARYRRLAGEVEAYNVMRRMGMTYEERLASLASQTEDVAREDQIFLERGRQALMAMQSAESHSYATGNIQRLDDGDFLIRLFRGANLSTLAHEISHAVHLEMERLEREGKGTDALKRDLDTLRRWQAKFDDEAALRAEYDRYYKGLYGVEFDELDAVGKLAVKQRAQREMVARGFELYLREGESPTPAMEAVFRRMGKWMKRVYQNASQLDVEINDDVRGVFDRWLASEEDIAAAAAANDIHGFTAPLLDSLGVQGADRLDLEGMISDALGKASDALRRDRARYRRDHIQQWRDEVEQELANDPVYQARAAMRRTPIDLDAVVDTYGQELADELRVKLPASMKKGGDNPELLAFDYGFDNAGQMIRAIVNRPGTQERRKELLAQKMQDADAQFAAEDYLFEQEELRQREDKVGEALYRLELNSKTAMGRPVTPSQQDFEDFGSAEKNRWKIAREQLRTLVSNLLDEKEAQAAIQPDSYRRAAAKAMREERKAILAKDWAEAVKQNYLARVNMEAAYQAGKRRDMVNKLRRQAKRFLASATPDTRARFAVFGLSQKVSLFDPTMKMVQNAADKGMDDIRAFLEKMKDEGFYTVDAAIPETLFDGQKQNWQLMDWKDLQPYLEGMAVLMHMERESRKANSEAAKAEWRAEMDGLAASILALNPHRNPHADQKKRLDIVRFLKEVHASHLKAETICLLLDGDQDMGPMWRAIIAPINRAQADRDRRMKKARDDVKRLFGVYEASEWVDIRGKRITVPSLGRGLTKEQALVIALNSGNDSNLERLRGMGYKDNEIREIIDLLDERDVRFVQSVWDYLETFRKESFDLEEKLTGVRPQAIEAKPLQTRFGELRGGYYPVSYDPQESSKPIDAESLGTLTGSMMPAVDHGSMKQRTATGLGTPLKLTLEVVPNHVAKTLHMLAFREPVRQVARVLNDKAVNAAIESTMGVEISKALKSWLHYVAGERPGVNGWSKALSMLRKNSALYSMGVKLTTILAQMTGLLASTAEIGPRWVAAGLADTYCRQNPFVVYRETAALSPMMENRMRSVDRDLYEMSTGLMAKGSTNKVLDKFVKFQHLQEQYAFLPVGFVQMAFADLPTWRGAYAKALHEGRSQAEAIEYADAIVTRTQTGGADKDLAAVQRGQELGKIMTQYYSFYSSLYQLFARRMTMLKRSGFRSTEEWARLGTLFLLTGVAEPILSAIFTVDTPEDDEDWSAWMAKKVFFNPWNMVVGVRDVFGAVESLVDGYGGKSRAASLLNDSIDTGVRFLSQLAKGEDMDPRAALKSGWKGVGLLTGIVNAQELLFLEAFWDWLEDTNPDFEWADLVRRKK